MVFTNDPKRIPRIAQIKKKKKKEHRKTELSQMQDNRGITFRVICRKF